jgi:hypothetical protein
MISKLYYIHLGMTLLFQPFVSMPNPISQEIARISEEKGRRRRTTREKCFQNNPQGMLIYLHEDKCHMASLRRSSCNPFSP